MPTLSPPKLHELVGQKNLIRILTDEMDASLARNTALPNACFTGAPGTGKTLIGKVLAYTREVPIFEFLGVQVTETNLCHAITETRKRCSSAYDSQGKVIHRELVVPAVWIFNELDGASKDILQILYDLFLPQPDGRRICWIKRVGSSASDRVWCPEFTGIITSNFLGTLRKKAGALIDRCPIKWQFEPYTDEELEHIVGLAAEAEGVKIDDAAITMIAARSVGTPRTAEFLYDRCSKRLSAQIHRKRRIPRVITAKIVMEALEVLRIDDLGLGAPAQAYLKALAQNPIGKLGASSLAATIGTDTETMTQDIEPFLMRQGLVTVVSGGRQITPQGLIHIGSENANPIHEHVLKG